MRTAYDRNRKPDRIVRTVLSVCSSAYLRHPRLVTLAVVGRVVAAALTVAAPAALGLAVKLATSHHVVRSHLLLAIGLYAGAWFASRTLSATLTQLYGRVEQDVQTDSIVRWMNAAQSMSPVARVGLQTAEVSFAIDNAAAGVRAILWTVFGAILPAVATAVVGALVIFRASGAVPTVIFIVGSTGFVLATGPLIRLHERRQRASIGAAMSSFGYLENSLAAWREVRLLDAKTYLERRYRLARRPFETAVGSTYRVTSLLGAVQAAIVYSTLGAMLSVQVFQSPGASAARLVVVAGVGLAGLVPLESLGLGASQLVVGVAEVRHLEQLLDVPDAPSLRAPQFRRVVHRRRRLICSDLSPASVAGDRVIGPIDLNLAPGRPLWVLGPSGAGKTLVLDTLAGLGPSKGGSVMLSGPAEPRSIGYLTQSNTVLNDSVRNNVAFGHASDDQVIQALRRAGFSVDSSRRARLDDPAAGDGARLSGGEERRMLLARALVSDPLLLLCDEPTSGLDTEKREAVWRTLESEAKRRLVVVATHDPEAPVRQGDVVIRL